MPDRLIVYGANCVWWDSIDKVKLLDTPSGRGPGIPCCPHCGSVLFQETEKKWWASVDRYEREGHPGYRQMVEWWRGRCFPNMDAMKAAYAKETGNG